MAVNGIEWLAVPKGDAEITLSLASCCRFHFPLRIYRLWLVDYEPSRPSGTVYPALGGLP